jgi:hypothetical protein
LSRGSFVDPTADIPDNISVVSKILLVYEEYSEMMTIQSALIRVGFDVLGITTEYTLSENVLSFNPDLVVALGRGGKVTTLGVGRRLREMTRWQGRAILILPAGYKPNPQDFGKVRADMLLEAPVPLSRLVQVLAKMLGIDETIALERLLKPSVDVTPAKEMDAAIPNLKPAAAEEAMVIKGGAAGEVQNNTPFEISSPKSPKAKEQDLESLWKELTENADPQKVKGKISEEVPREEVRGSAIPGPITFDLKEREKELNEHELDVVAKDLENARRSEHERVSKYARFTDKAPEFDTRQSLSKVAARKAQKGLTSTWNQAEITSQDKARQEFTKALFRKK